LLLVILGKILALKPPETAGWFQKNYEKGVVSIKLPGGFRKTAKN